MAEADSPPHLILVRGKGGPGLDHVITVEDVIVHKLIAWRPRDRSDIASILEAGHPLDLAYIERWAAEWDVLGRWEQARAAR